MARRDDPLSRAHGAGATAMFEMVMGWLAFFVVVAVLAVLALLADVWGVDTRDDFASRVDRFEHH